MNGFMVVLALLAGTTAYFATKASVLEDHLARRDNLVATTEASESSSASATPTTSPTTSNTAESPVSTTSQSPVPAPTTVSVGNRLSALTESYTVVAGDTLYPISLKYNMSLERLAEANGLIDPYALKIGQVLAIPEVDAKQKVFEVRFTTDPTKAKLVQETVASGSDTWRLDPKEVAKAEHSSVFGLTASDDFHLESRDDTAGTAVVAATRLVGSVTKTYEIYLTEPATKGTAGIWSITRIVPKA